MSRRAVRRYEAALADRKYATRGDDAGVGQEEEMTHPAAKSAEFHREGQTSSEDDAAGSPVAPAKNVMNMFDMLSMGSDEDHVEDAAGEEGSSVDGDLTGGSRDTANSGVTNSPVVGQQSGMSPGEAVAKRKRRRKKRKGKTKAHDEDWALLEGTGVREPELLETSVADGAPGEGNNSSIHVGDALNIGNGPGQTSAESRVQDLIPQHLLNVDSKLLSTESEMKQLFGSRVVEAGRASDDLETLQQLRRHGRGRMQVSSHLRKSYFVHPRDTWVRNAPGLVVVMDSAANEAVSARAGQQRYSGSEPVCFFRYSHEKRYQRIQLDFEVIRQTHNPNNLVALINRVPYHVDSLLMLAEVYRQTGELERAGEMIERALYLLESSWPRSFKPFNGKCRMSFNVRENQSLFHALFRHVQILARRGLHRTALESAKLLYGLDPPLDPKGVLLVMDSLALMCGQYDWVRAMHDDSAPGILKLFPNFCVSTAVASHLTHSTPSRSKKESKPKPPVSSSAEHFGHPDPVPVKDGDAFLQMTEALLAFPMVLRPIVAVAEDASGLALCDKYELYDDEPANADDPGGVLGRICRIYAQCSKGLWTGSVLQLLHDAAIIAGSSAAGGRGNEGLALAEVGRDIRGEFVSFLSMSQLYRGLIPADFGDSETSIPAELLAALNAEESAEEVFPTDALGVAEALDVAEASDAPRDPRDFVDPVVSLVEDEEETPSGDVANSGSGTWRETISTFVQNLTTWSADNDDTAVASGHDSASSEVEGTREDSSSSGSD